MKKFLVEVDQRGSRKGSFYIEAPDIDAAYVLAQDIKLSEPTIKWEEFSAYGQEYPRPEDIFINEHDEARS